MREEHVLLSLLATAAVALVFHARASSVARIRARDASLKAAYDAIRSAASTDWPQSQGICAKCVRDAQGRLHPPEFVDGCGPIGVYSMIASTGARAYGGQAACDANLQTLRWCAAAFEDFVCALCNGLDAQTARLLREGCWIANEKSWHTCVTIYHEHPCMLSADECVHWQPIDEVSASTLAAALRARLATMSVPMLSLDSLVICKDGALIAGFVDDVHGSFSKLRDATASVGHRVIGGILTSRPKRLIHVTLGRVLECPPLGGTQREHIENTVRQFNMQVLPERVRSRVATLSLTSASLARDTTWWMTQFDEISTFPFASQAHCTL
uniref:Uncharacterized protein n=1 Tax=Coccolithus braarudii TaxID=221442 RepID=A0A7S0Q9K8_9EUKA|mmetsp:Transcript_8179/g.17959  ORF Transcript_8179/g.17959 Transcript_8179/m.17959 type:complete len:327 (+) Transcript_8179:31-1011(+)